MNQNHECVSACARARTVSVAAAPYNKPNINDDARVFARINRQRMAMSMGK